MEKILVIIAHPHLDKSIINKSWVKALSHYPEKFTIHDLYATYPDEVIDVQFEQQLVEKHTKIVFQFPFYWYSGTPLLKKWFDQVLSYGWAYGSQGNKMLNRKFAIATSVGSDATTYTAEGSCGMTLPQLLTPFEASARFVKAQYCAPFIFYGANEASSIPEQLPVIAQNYLDYLAAL